MKIIREYTEGIYTIQQFENGTEVKFITPVESQSVELTADEMHKMKIETDLEYIKCLTEMSVGI